MKFGAAGEIRTPEVRHHWISNPAQWPGYATAARKLGDQRSSHEHDGGQHFSHSSTMKPQRGPSGPSMELGMKMMRTSDKNIHPR